LRRLLRTGHICRKRGGAPGRNASHQVLPEVGRNPSREQPRRPPNPGPCVVGRVALQAASHQWTVRRSAPAAPGAMRRERMTLASTTDRIGTPHAWVCGGASAVSAPRCGCGVPQRMTTRPGRASVRAPGGQLARIGRIDRSVGRSATVACKTTRIGLVLWPVGSGGVGFAPRCGHVSRPIDIPIDETDLKRVRGACATSVVGSLWQPVRAPQSRRTRPGCVALTKM